MRNRKGRRKSWFGRADIEVHIREVHIREVDLEVLGEIVQWSQWAWS